MLAELDLTAANAKTELTTEQNLEWLRVFGQQPGEALQWAFRGWRAESRYAPAISDILGLVRDWHRNQRWMAEERERREERVRLDESRARGELVEFADIMKRLKDVAKTIPEPEHCRRIRALRQRQVNSCIPAIRLSPEQIEARVEMERAEIARYVEAAQEAGYTTEPEGS